MSAFNSGSSTTAFIEGIRSALREGEAKGMRLPVERRKLRTLTTEIGRRGSKRFLYELQVHLTESGIYTEPPLSDSGLRLDDWVLFSTGPFPPDSAFFPKERDLQRFVEACLGTSVFRNLESCRLDGKSGREFRLPDGRRIDLLCQERVKSGSGALVAIELKREHQRGTVDQLLEYLDGLKALYPSRDVRGIIISDREDQVAAALLRGVTRHKIEWLCYDVTFERVSSSS